jgi:hypothetical protein
VDRALAKDPRDRFPSMDAFAAELEACLAQLAAANGGDATQIVTPVRPQPARGRRRRRSPWPILLGLLALLAIGVIAVAVVALGDGTTGSSGTTGGGTRVTGTRVALTAMSSYDPQGDGEEHAESVPNAVDGNAATYWTTEHYTSLSLQKDGVGFVVEAPGGHLRTMTLSTDTPGFGATIQAGASPGGGFAPVSRNETVNGTTTFDLRDVGGPYYLIWVTRLPPGSEVAHVNEVKATQ